MLEVINLVAQLGGAPVLHDLSATFQAGKITAICGPNGAGKSTLLSTLAGLIDPLSGLVCLDGTPCKGIAREQRARQIGYLPQSADVAWNLSVGALAGLGRLPHGDAAVGPVEAALAAVDLSHMAQRGVATLSGGEKARALLARVLAGEPQWILADEPLAALDLSHQLAMLRHLRVAADAGAGVVLVLHDLPLAMNHADEVLVLNNGRAHEKGPPEAALCEKVIQDVWQVPARWLGEPGARGLSVSL